MSLFYRKERTLTPSRERDFLFESLEQESILKEAKEKKKRSGIDPDFMKKFFANEHQRTIFYETAPLVYYMANEIEPTFEQLKSVVDNSDYREELGSDSSSLNELFKKVTDKRDKEKLEQAFRALGASSYSQLKSNKILKNFRVVGFIRNSINQYKKLIPETLRETDSKENTADVLLIFRGTKNEIFEYIKTIDITKEDVIQQFSNGVIGGKGDPVQFIQVSMKMDADSARVGRVMTKLINKLGLTHSAKSGFSDVLQESLLSYTKDKLNNAWRYIQQFASGLYEKIKDIGQKILIYTNASSEAKRIREKNDLEFSKALNISMRDIQMLSEDVNQKIKLKDQDIISVVTRIKEKLNLYKSEILKLEASSLNKETFFQVNISEFITDKDIDIISQTLIQNKTRNNLKPLIKLNANVSALEFFIFLIKKSFESGMVKKISNSFIELAKTISTEAIFGDTLLPLWKFYGGDKGIEFLGFKDDHKVDVREISKSKYPIFILDVHKSGGGRDSEFSWNVVNLYVIDTDNLNFTPEQDYFVIEMTTESGSKFSFKIEVNSKTKFKKIIR